MTSKNTFASDTHNLQDAIERHVHHEVKYEDGAGMIVKVRGNGTEDPDVQVIRFGGVWVHLPKGMNADVFLVAGSADTTQKHAIPDIPRDKHKKTKAGTSGFQHPTNPDISVEASDKGIRVYGDNFAVGKDGALEVKDGKTIIRNGLTVLGGIKADKIETPDLTANTIKGTVGGPGATTTPVVPAIEPVEDAADVPSS